ncbi:thyroid hormone receptor alpha isoform X2, partial [Biomphalaria glabrata]
PDKTFRNLLSLLPLLNQINQSHIKFLNNIKDKSPEMFSAHFPQLHQEVFVS